FIKFLLGVRSSINRFEAKKSVPENKIKMQKFSDVFEFRQYLNQAEKKGMFFYGGLGMGGPMEGDEEDFLAQQAFMDQGAGAKDRAAAQRVSSTNVQVLNIDEPDIVKTDGENIYFSRERRILPLLEEQEETLKIKALPPERANVLAKIKKSGEFFLAKDTLVIFGAENKIYGYKTGGEAEPEESWKIELKDRTVKVASRLYNDKIYLVTRTYIDQRSPCPFEPLIIKGQGIEVGCDKIYHPREVVPTDSTYEVMIIDPFSGELEKVVSFVGSMVSQNVYMSEESIYIAYDYPGDILGLITGIVGENSDLMPNSLIERLEKIKDYDLGNSAKMAEIQEMLEKQLRLMDDDERLRFENEMTNRAKEYMRKHSREYEKTGITKISVKDLEIKASAAVPGSLLNQFSMDEFEGNLRLATTVRGQGIWMPGLNLETESVNDVYVLDGKMKLIGSIRDLGFDERVYSARFLGDKGYLVTFKEIDPFFVMDLSDAKNPRVEGELKIPGFSSYLHPIGDDLILGIGREENKVKVSLFDVSSPENPREKSKYILDEGWSQIQNTHHAFLQDLKHEIFFLPGSRGGYIFSWAKDELKLIKAVSQEEVKRAVYLDDYLYVIGERGLRVFNENDWAQAGELGW
ncbi:beta-propeller domain-containing protein, partial [Patescibacteria group bacterium]|nr:beta-propeller domain-containing protein [Patescibacteria group bacterium]